MPKTSEQAVQDVRCVDDTYRDPASLRRATSHIQSEASLLSSAALCRPSFSLIRIWWVSIVLTLRCSSAASRVAPNPRPNNEKTCSSRSLNDVTFELLFGFI